MEMGQDFRAILSHDLTEADLPTLVERLNATTVALTEFLNQARLSDISYVSAPLEWRWAWSAANQPDVERWSSDALDLAGIGSMSFTLGHHCVTFGCWVRWVELVTDKAVQQAIREIVFRFASVFHSEFAIYVPDSSSLFAEGALNRVHEGARGGDILNYLREQRPPAVSIHSICTRVTTVIEGRSYEATECDGYYMDEFADLKSVKT